MLASRYCGRAVVTSALVVLANSSAVAQTDGNLDGNTLYSVCTSADEGVQAICAAYVIGYREGRKWGSFTALRALSEPDETTADVDALGDLLAGNCVPDEVTYEQLIDVAVKFMVDHPARRHESARSLVWDSFNRAFPCE